jgi:hypothetical protein
MKLITNLELAAKSERELSTLFGAVSKQLAKTTRGTAQRRNALASLENISRARIARLCQP